MVKDGDTRWMRNRVNRVQTPAERSAKYHLARQLGANVSWALSLRDCRWTRIFRWSGLPTLTRRDCWNPGTDKPTPQLRALTKQLHRRSQ